MEREGTLYFLGLWWVKHGKEDEFFSEWKKFAEWTMIHMEGTRQAVLLEDEREKNRFVSYGPWDNHESLERWRQGPEFKAAFQKLNELCYEIQPNTMRCVSVLRKTPPV
jgi:quinol monooxygenase YgiN